MSWFVADFLASIDEILFYMGFDIFRFSELCVCVCCMLYVPSVVGVSKPLLLSSPHQHRLPGYL
jgi:hypothetical protein